MKGSGLATGTERAAAGDEARSRRHEGLSRDELLNAYRLMLLSRRIDDKEIQLKNQRRSLPRRFCREAYETCRTGVKLV